MTGATGAASTVTGPTGAPGPTGATGPTGRPAVLSLYTGTLSFTLTAGTPTTQTLTQANVTTTRNLFIQGANITSGSAYAGGISAMYPSNAGTYWSVVMTVVGGSTGGTAAYTIYYYGVS